MSYFVKSKCLLRNQPLIFFHKNYGSGFSLTKKQRAEHQIRRPPAKIFLFLILTSSYYIYASMPLFAACHH